MDGFDVCDPCCRENARAREKEAGIARNIRGDLANDLATTTGLPRDLYKRPVRERLGRKELKRFFLEDDESDSSVE